MNITEMIGLTTGKTKLMAAEEAPVVTSKSTSAETTDNAPDTGEEFDTFLRLLTAQIKNQDPLAPLESTQFVEQLATFSGLELQANANNILEDIAAMLAQQTYVTPTTAAASSAETKSTLL